MPTVKFQLDATMNTSVVLANLDRETSSVSDLKIALDLVGTENIIQYDDMLINQLAFD